MSTRRNASPIALQGAAAAALPLVVGLLASFVVVGRWSPSARTA